VCGDVRRPGVYERETTITLRELFYDVAGGPREGRRFKAALPGVSARVIPAEKFDAVADYGSLKAIGSGLGSAGFMLFDDTRSMVRVAQTVARFLYVESCDQCTACKYGLGIASQALDTLFDAHKAVPVAISHTLNGARIAPSSNRCYLPVQGSLLIPSLIEHFGDEFLAQAKQPFRNSDLVPLFKIVDFDVKTGEFIYDTRQQLKNPDWSYSDVVAHELGT
jgi:NADH:ubiquinone oxidoreductase subunit F (NADH-binding)